MAGTSHGHTPAAWTGVIIVFIGFCAAGAFMVMANPIGFWASMAVIVVGAVVGYAMKLAGFGVPKETEAAARTRNEAGRLQTH